MKIPLFLILFFIVFLFMSWYISKRFVAKLDLSNKIKKMINLFLAFNLLGVLGYIGGRYYPHISDNLYFLFSFPIGVIFLFFCAALFYDILRVTVEKIPLHHSRRKFFKKSLDGVAIFGSIALSAKALYEARFVEIEKVEITLKNLSQEYRIVQLSDIHIGGLIDEEFIQEIVSKVNNLNPDIVVITGDLIDIDVELAKKSLYQFTNLNTQYGVYFIVGNHEYFHGVEDIIKVVNSLGIKVLENENLYIGEKGKGFNLAGVYDIFGYRLGKYEPDISKALENREQNAPTILLAHQPRYISEVTYGVDLMLSGHTHGGQIYPFRFLVKLQQPYVSGLHQHNEKLQIYVNKGTGFWGPPMRLGASSEITEIFLKPA